MEVPFSTLPEDPEAHLELILVKILDNFSAPNDFRKLTSFSKSEEVAIQHAGFCGWLIEIEVDHRDLLDVVPYLERAKSQFSPKSEQWSRITEAALMAQEDQEMFLKFGASYEVTDVSMLGSYHAHE